MNSMTGFGRTELLTRVGMFTIEISSVNNRFLEVSVRLPRQFFALEHKLRDLVQGKLNRGKIYLYVAFELKKDSPGRYAINENAAISYHKQLMAIKKQIGLSGDIRLGDLLLLPEIGTPEQESFDLEMVLSHLKKGVDKALGDLIKMRRKEGAALAKDMGQRLKTLSELTRQVSRLSVNSVDRHLEKLTTRIKELLDKPVPDPGRLEEEVAIMAEKTDITEECTRLLSHIDQAKGNLKRKTPIGREMNFILQEMNREANTIASKSADIEITRSAISMKEELEKLREQVQNVE